MLPTMDERFAAYHKRRRQADEAARRKSESDHAAATEEAILDALSPEARRAIELAVRREQPELPTTGPLFRYLCVRRARLLNRKEG